MLSELLSGLVASVLKGEQLDKQLVISEAYDLVCKNYGEAAGDKFLEAIEVLTNERDGTIDNGNMCERDNRLYPGGISRGPQIENGSSELVTIPGVDAVVRPNSGTLVDTNESGVGGNPGGDSVTVELERRPITIPREPSGPEYDTRTDRRSLESEIERVGGSAKDKSKHRDHIKHRREAKELRGRQSEATHGRT